VSVSQSEARPARRSVSRASGEPLRMRSPWIAWGASFGVILSVCLAPWPGWGDVGSSAYCAIANCVAAVAPSGTVRVLFQPADDPAQGGHGSPWNVDVYLQQVSSGEVRSIPHGERMEYASVATFLALTAASALQRKRTRLLWAIGVPALLLICALNECSRIVLHLDQWRWLSLGPAAEVVLSAGYALLNGMPLVPFALPGLLWWGLSSFESRRGSIVEP
jgi:hypothetical protein